MARIPDQIIDRIKREVAVERVVAASGVKLSRHGNDLHGLCPFHDDKEPSLVVSPKKNLWHCLGACRAGITNIVLPADNLPDLEDLSEAERNRITVHPASELGDVLKVAFRSSEDRSAAASPAPDRDLVTTLN